MWKKHWLTEVNDNNVAPVSGRGFILGDWIVKNKTIAYVLWIFGLHGFYLDKPSASSMVWSALFISLFLMPFTLGFSILAFLFVWLADLALIPKWIDEANEKARVENE